MNNRERQMLRGMELYIRSTIWFRMPYEQKNRELRRFVRTIRESRCKK